MAKLSGLGWVTRILVVIGALNWGLIGLFDWNLVNVLFGTVTWLETTIYVLVGLSGLWELIELFR